MYVNLEKLDVFIIMVDVNHAEIHLLSSIMHVLSLDAWLIINKDVQDVIKNLSLIMLYAHFLSVVLLIDNLFVLNVFKDMN